MLDFMLYRTIAGQRSFQSRAVGQWNGLLDYIKDFDNINNFKRSLKNVFLKNAGYKFANFPNFYFSNVLKF